MITLQYNPSPHLWTRDVKLIKKSQCVRCIIYDWSQLLYASSFVLVLGLLSKRKALQTEGHLKAVKAWHHLDTEPKRPWLCCIGSGNVSLNKIYLEVSFPSAAYHWMTKGGIQIASPACTGYLENILIELCLPGLSSSYFPSCSWAVTWAEAHHGYLMP